MQKVKQGHFTKYPLIRLFKDDIENIVAIFEKNFDIVEVIIDGYKIPKIDDIDQLKKKVVTDLSIEGKWDYKKPNAWEENAELNLTNYKADLYISNDEDTKLRGIELQIGNIIKARKRKTTIFFTSFLFIILTFSLAIIFAFITSVIYHILPDISAILIFSITIPLVTIWSLLNIKSQKSYSIIELTDFNAKDSFFTRKKDDLLIALISTSLGVILGIIGTLITQWLSTH